MIRLRPYPSSDQFAHRRPCSKVLRDGLNAFDIFASSPYTALKDLRRIGRTYPHAPRGVPRSVIDNLKTAHDICAPNSDVAFFDLPKTQWSHNASLCVDAPELQIRSVLNRCPPRLHLGDAHGNGNIRTGRALLQKKAMDDKSLEYSDLTSYGNM